ncbi:MAG TPA: ABC transporter permease [Xanthobacteraceae bacterium]
MSAHEHGAGSQLIDDGKSAVSRSGIRIGRHLAMLALRVMPWVLIILLWQLVTLTGMAGNELVPSPIQVWSTFWKQLTTDRLWLDIYMSSQRVLLGLASGIVLAIPVAFALGWYRSARRIVDPLVNFFRALPPIALIPLVIVYFGIEELAKVVMLFYAAFFSGVIVMYEGIVQTNPLFVRVARSFGATDQEIFWRVVVPLSVPHVLTALRVALGVCWATLVASELIAAQRGLGAVIENASNYFQLDTIYMGIICIGIIALTMDASLRAISAHVLKWQDRIAS